MEFAYDGGGLAKGGTVSLYVDGQRVGEGHVDRTEPMAFSADETLRASGTSWGSPVRLPRVRGRTTTGSAERSTGCKIDLGKDNHDHLISPEDQRSAGRGRAAVGHPVPSTSRWLRLIVLALIFAASATTRVVAVADSDPLGSWNDGDAKRAIVALVRRATTDRSSPELHPPRGAHRDLR